MTKLSTTSKIDALKETIRSLEQEEVLIATNEGTFGCNEAVLKVGCSQPEFCNYRVYESIGDMSRRHEGCDIAKAPGYERYINRDILCKKRQQLTTMKIELKNLTK